MDRTEIVANITAGGGWVFIPELDVCICVPTKNGCSAVYGQLVGRPEKNGRLPALEQFAARGLGPMLPTEVSKRYPDKRKLLSVRGPIDRFASLWRNFCRDVPIKGRDRVGRRRIAGMSPQELISFIRKHPLEDRHWIPQARHWLPGAELVPFNQMLEHIGLPSPKINVTKRLVTDPPMPEDEIREHYWEDVKLWLAAQ